MFKKIFGITIDLTPETCTLGMLSGVHFNIIKTCMVIIKYFIFTCKLQNTTPVFRECVEQIKVMFHNPVSKNHHLKSNGETNSGYGFEIQF